MRTVIVSRRNENRLRGRGAASCVAALAAGCGVVAGDDGRRDVVAAFYPLAFAAERVGGDRVSVTNLTPPGRGAARRRADAAGGRAASRGPTSCSTSRTASSRRSSRRPPTAHRRRVDALDGVDCTRRRRRGRDGDPHVWLDPVLFARRRRAGSARRSARPSAATRARGASSARSTASTARASRDCARREFVTSHARVRLPRRALPAARRSPITGIEPEAEPSAQTLADARRALVRREHVDDRLLRAARLAAARRDRRARGGRDDRRARPDRGADRRTRPSAARTTSR